MQFSILTLILVAIPSLELAPQPNREGIAIQQLVEALKSPDYRRRTDATQELKTIGSPAFTMLKQVLAKSDSPEQIWRAKEILLHIEELQLDAMMLKPRMVQLPVVKTTVGEALQSLNVQDEIRFAAVDWKLYARSIDLPQTELLPLWSAIKNIQQLSQISQVTPTSAMELSYLPLSDRSIKVRQVKNQAITAQITELGKAITKLSNQKNTNPHELREAMALLYNRMGLLQKELQQNKIAPNDSSNSLRRSFSLRHNQRRMSQQM